MKQCTYLCTAVKLLARCSLDTIELARTARSCDSSIVPRKTKPEPLPLSIFRLQPGEYVREVTRNGKRYLLTKAGKPAALLVPVEDGDA